MTISPAHSRGEIQATIARALSGDQSAYAALYDLYAASLYRLCYSLLNNEQDAEDNFARIVSLRL